jgi:putative flippase GtrA
VKLIKVFSQYPTYILVGGGVTLLTVMLRSLIGLLIEDDTVAKYMSSIILAYILGILLSFLAHKNITFKARHSLSIAKSFNFVAIHFVGMSITLIGSTTLREKLLDARLPIELSKLFAFAASALVVSVITYLLKQYLVFEKS